MMQKYSSYILCLLISILVVALYINDFSPLVNLERKIGDVLYSFRGDETKHGDIVLIAIDKPTLSKFGEWPWHRDQIADLLAAVGSGGPRTVLLDIPFEPSTDEDTSGYTEILAGQMSWVKNVILPYEIGRAEFQSSRVSMPEWLYHNALSIDNELGILSEKSGVLVKKTYLPPKELCAQSAGLGFRYNAYDDDRQLRWESLIMYYEGYYYPSISLMAAANFLRIKPNLITVHEGEKIIIGSKSIPINDQVRMFINYNTPGQSFVHFSAADVLNESVKFTVFKDKMVIISLQTESLTERHRTPVSPAMWEQEQTANVIENIIHGNFIKRYDNNHGTDLLVLFALGGMFAFILPRVSLMYRIIILFGSLFLLINLNFILFNSYQIVTRSLYMALELFLLLLACPFLDNEFMSRFSDSPVKAKGASRPPRIDKFDETLARNERPAPSMRAWQIREKAGTVTPDTSAMTGQDAREFEKTTAAGTDQEERTEALTPKQSIPPQPDQRQPQAPTPVSPPEAVIEYNAVKLDNKIRPDKQESSQTVAQFGPGDSGKLKNLGRYQVLDILGQGAMGTVYKGVDPAINRNVALKTIRLDFVNDPEEQDELRERLFREAQAAGKLSHPNIVTVYDMGTEGTLSYIAMEYLEGQTLEDMIRKKVKFNYKIIAQIITQVCSALEYAHEQGIVHRDIKPANIMVLSDYKVKVMDFGIARIDSSSMTRTGIAMGTPNYISPEQLQGQPVDHRTDIFSLGVMMYEMILHRRPFKGENLTSLIYSIINTEPEPPSTINKSIPNLFDRVIERALCKKPEDRFQKASEVALALSDFIDSFSSKKTMV